jgi:hypothetical protein
MDSSCRPGTQKRSLIGSPRLQPTLRCEQPWGSEGVIEAHFTSEQVARTIVDAYNRLLRQAGA